MPFPFFEGDDFPAYFFAVHDHLFHALLDMFGVPRYFLVTV